MLSGKIAWRNVWRHKGKSLVIGIILFLGAFLMTVGNSIINGARQGLENNMINRFTGRLVIKPADQKVDEVFLGGPTTLKILPDYPAIKSILKQRPMVKGYVPMTRGMASVLNPDGNPGQIFIYGVNFEEYQKIFLNNIEALEGRLIERNAKGIIITQKIREQIFDIQNFWVVPKGLSKEDTVLYQNAPFSDADDPKIVSNARKKADEGRLKTAQDLIVLGFGSNSFGNDIRAPVQGIFKFKNLNQVWKEVSYMDIESFRDAFGYISAANQTLELTDRQQEIMDTDSEEMDALFGDVNIVKRGSVTTEAVDLSALKLKPSETQRPVDIDQGAYNFVAIKLADGIELEEAQKRLQKAFDDAGLPVAVLTWEDAIGTVSQFMLIGQSALHIFVLFIFFVAIIIIMNTLSMAAMERMTEIGMMRAVGAQKRFIRKMFLMETFFLAFAFGGAGIFFGVIASYILAGLDIPVASNEMLSLMFASDTFNPVITLSTLISGIVRLGIVTILAVLYPLFVAGRITPMEAIARD